MSASICSLSAPLSKGALRGSVQYWGALDTSARIGEQWLKIELALLRGLARQDLQPVGGADELGEAAHTQARHDLPAFLGHEPEVVHDHLRQPDEIAGAQHVVLRGDAGRAIVQVADAQVLAAERHHGRGAEAEALRADDRRLDDVEPGLQAAVGLQPHAVPQIVGAQRLMGLGEAELPGRARVLDRGQRARAGTAVVARDGDEVRVCLRDARGHGADAGLGDELHRHERLRIDLLQIEDELRQILDRIDVVMRRRRDEPDARTREPQARDHLVHLVPGKLSAFAGLRALRDLDLQHLGIDQVTRASRRTVPRRPA